MKTPACPFYSIYYKKSTYKRIIYKPWNKIKIKKTEQFGFSNATFEIIIIIIISNNK